MKSPVIFDLLRRAILSFLLMVAILWSVAPAYAGNATVRQSTEAVTVKAASNDEVQELKSRLKDLDESTRKNYDLELERGRKQVDWWMTFLGVLAAIMAIAGGLIPYLMSRKDKEIIEQDKAQIRQLLEEVKGMKTEAKDSVEEIHRHEAEAEAAKKAVMNFQSGISAAENKEAQEAAAKIEQDKTADPLLRLRAEAVSASNPETAEKAYKLWAALAELEVNDAVAQLNAGYWAGMIRKECQENEKPFWVKLLKQHSVNALQINPEEYWAANNLGAALFDEARALSATDLGSARTLWKQARERYQQALNIKPDMHVAASNLGIALDAEASAIAGTDLPAARLLWQQAGEKYRQALAIKPDMHEAAYNWGVVLGAEAVAIAGTDLSAARTLWQQAGEKYRQALAIKPDKHEAAYNWGSALGDEAVAIAGTDLSAARTLWQQAGEKYRQALAIKPDMHEAASVWGNTLLIEASAIRLNDPEQFRRLLDEAEQLLLNYANKAPSVVAYNLACVYGIRENVQPCLKWLRIAQEHKSLPDCKHLREDKDLDPVRNDPEFIEWFKQVCS